MTKPCQVSGYLSELVARNGAKLTPADSRLLDVLIQDPLRAAMENGKDVSQRAGVHPAAAVRLARRLGFDGYSEFRAFLQANLVEGGDFESGSARVAARLMRVEAGGTLSGILNSEIAALQQVATAVSDSDIRAFAETLRDGRRIFLFGRSHAASLTSLMASRLRRSGYDAVDLSAVPHQLGEQLAGLSAGDVLWVFAFRHPAPVLLEVMRLAAARKARILALTDIPGARLDPSPDHLIAASRGEPGGSQSLVVPMTIANAIVLDLAAVDGGRSIRALEEFRVARDALSPLVGR